MQDFAYPYPNQLNTAKFLFHVATLQINVYNLKLVAEIIF